MTERAELLDALLADPARASAVPREQAVTLLIGLAPVVRALELLAVQAQAPAAESPNERPPRRLLTVSEAAERSRKSKRWIQDNWQEQLPFGVKKGRSVLFPLAEFEKWLRRP